MSVVSAAPLLRLGIQRSIRNRQRLSATATLFPDWKLRSLIGPRRNLMDVQVLNGNNN